MTAANDTKYNCIGKESFAIDRVDLEFLEPSHEDTYGTVCLRISFPMGTGSLVTVLTFRVAEDMVKPGWLWHEWLDEIAVKIEDGLRMDDKRIEDPAADKLLSRVCALFVVDNLHLYHEKRGGVKLMG